MARGAWHAGVRGNPTPLGADSASARRARPGYPQRRASRPARPWAPDATAADEKPRFAAPGDGVLEQGTRRLISDAIGGSPGINLSELRETTGLGWGTLQHHLRVLEAAGLIRRILLGRDAYLYPSRMEAHNQYQNAVLRNASAQRIARALLAQPGRIQKEICEELNMTRKVFLAHIRLLEAAGLVEIRRGPLRKNYRPTAALEAFAGPEGIRQPTKRP